MQYIYSNLTLRNMVIIVNDLFLMLCKACNIGKRNDYNDVPVSGLIDADCV